MLPLHIFITLLIGYPVTSKVNTLSYEIPCLPFCTPVHPVSCGYVVFVCVCVYNNMSQSDQLSSRIRHLYIFTCALNVGWCIKNYSLYYKYLTSSLSDGHVMAAFRPTLLAVIQKILMTFLSRKI